MSDYDIIVIGSGAGGGTLVHHLASSGKKILLLERGDWLPREPQNWTAQDVFVDGRYISPDTWYYADLTPFQAHVHAVNPALTVMANALRVGDHLLERLGTGQPQVEVVDAE